MVLDCLLSEFLFIKFTRWVKIQSFIDFIMRIGNFSVLCTTINLVTERTNFDKHKMLLFV